MDQSSPRKADAVGRNRSSSYRQQVLGAVLVVLALGYGSFTYQNWNNTKDAKRAGDDYSAFMAAVAKADAIADPLQRCLSYPDFPGSHWNEETTRAYCQLRNHKTISLTDIEALLKQGKAGEVDRVFQGYLDTQRRDPQQPGLLDIAFTNAGFSDATDNTRRVIDMWKQQQPNSAFALAASGVQYVDAAQQARGTGWGNDLTDQQVDGMDQQLALAVKDLNRSVSLDPSITVIFPAMIHAGGLSDDDTYMDNAVELALKADPSNYAIRMQMMNHAQRKWGGNFGGIITQSKEDLALVFKNPLLRIVAQRPVVYRATCDCYGMQELTDRLVLQAVDKNVSATDMVDLAYPVYDANRRLAVELYSEAIRFGPVDDVDALRWRSQEMIALGDKAGAVATFAAVARRFPDNDAVATQLGNIYAQVGDVKNAETTLLAVLQRDPDNFKAMGILGDLYNHAGHQPQKAEVLADAMISQHPDEADGYIVRACNQMDHNLPGVYDTIHYFIDRFGDDPQWKTQTAEMRAYLIKHPEKIAT
jgi:tetratricopeptide (TPR) repeat protein